MNPSVRLKVSAAWMVLLALAIGPRPAMGQSAPAPDAPTGVSAQQPPPERERIVDVRVEGNKRVEKDAIVRVLKNRPGEWFDPTKSADDLKAIWGLGYFSDVQLLTQRSPKGLIYVVRVEERPAVREVRLEGNEELSKDDLKEAIKIKPFSILDLEAVRRDEKKIQEKYIEKGYFLAEVNHRIEKVKGSSDVDVVFVIREHAKVTVKEIHFIGAQRVSADELKGLMMTKEGSYLSFITGEGTFREEVFQHDLAGIQADYYDHGFVNVKLDKPSLSLSADKRYIFISLKVEEGEQYSIGKLDFRGDLLVPKEQLFALLSSHSAEIFNRSKLAGDIQRLTDLYADQGYAYANVTPVTVVHPENRTIDLTFDIQKGPQVTIERIELSGNDKTRDRVIRRELRIYEGELYSGTGVRRSKERVTALGFFETVDITHKPGSDEHHVVMDVHVKEKATGSFQLGFGFSSVENFIFTLQISQNNFLGWGQSVSASAQLSGLRSLAQLNFFDPYFLDTNFTFSADAYISQGLRPDYIRYSRGADANVGYHLTEDVTGTLGYTLEHVNVEPAFGLAGLFGLPTTVSTNSLEVLPANRFKKGLLSSARASLTWDRRDNRLFPSKGFLHFGSVEVAPNFLGGTFNFIRYTGYSRFYVPLFAGIVFKTNITIGYMQELDPNNPLPISELYYLGGVNTIRGYYLSSISPVLQTGQTRAPDSTTTPFYVGGNKQLYGNFELEFPVVEKVGIRGVLFYDVGNVYAANENFFQSKQYNLPLGMFHSVGFGVRWFSPLGPLRFEWGIPLNRRPIDQPVDFQFGIGSFF